jgi:hypothetical protein
MTIDAGHKIDPALKVTDAKHRRRAKRPDGQRPEH